MDMKRIFSIIAKLIERLFKHEDEPVVSGGTEVEESGSTESGETADVPVESGETTGPIVETGGTDMTDIEIHEPVPDTETKEYRIVVLLDNGHAASTPGKRSPKEEGTEQFFEYEFNRDVVRRIAEKLKEIGIKYEILVPEVENDISLSSRAARANKFCSEYGTNNCIFISVHANAAGNGSSWMNAKGWCCYTSKGETVSDPYAELFMREAEKVLVPLGRTIRKYSQKKYSWEDNFTVLVKTHCPAILTENLFYDNKDEVEFLKSDEGRDAIAQIHVNTILKIENGEV